MLHKRVFKARIKNRRNEAREIIKKGESVMFWLGFLAGAYALGLIEFIGILVYSVKRGKKK